MTTTCGNACARVAQIGATRSTSVGEEPSDEYLAFTQRVAVPGSGLQRLRKMYMNVRKRKYALKAPLNGAILASVAGRLYTLW